MPNFDKYRVKEGAKIRLKDFDTADDGGMAKEDGEKQFAEIHPRLGELQEVLYAQSKHALLVVVQALDTGGKDSLIRTVFTGFNPTGCLVSSFKAPTELERGHDFLWRVHQCVPRRGYVGVFNRSHYEDVLIVRVHELVPEPVWKGRYQHINAFEQMLADEDVTIVKFFLHISKDYQKTRLQKRLDDPTKRWKFDPADLIERRRWDDYQKAYEDALSKCATAWAPWYVIPAEKRWYRNLLVTKILVKTMESMDLKYPKPTFDPEKIVVE